MVSPQDNYLLARLPADDLSALNRHFKTVELHPGETLAQPGDEIRRVFFPHSGIISFFVDLRNGDVVQSAMVGRDGVVGAAQALDDRVSLNRITVQLPVTASVIDRDPLREAIASGNGIRQIFAAHQQFLMADIQQTAACNAAHLIEARMSRWLLRMMDLVGVHIPLTQDGLAAMIGVRRTSVTLVAGHLQNAGIIRYRRGNVRIENVELLKELACECHAVVEQNYARLFGSPRTI